MTVDEYVKRMEELAADSDLEVAHSEADELLCQIIRRYLPEYVPVLDAYGTVGKWYA